MPEAGAVHHAAFDRRDHHHPLDGARPAARGSRLWPPLAEAVDRSSAITDQPKRPQDTPPPPAGAELPGAALDQIAGGQANVSPFGSQSGPKPRPGH